MIREYRKYPNRRLFDMTLKRYATLRDIADAIRDRDTVRVVTRNKANPEMDGRDVTRELLLDVLASVEARCSKPLLSVDRLHEMLSISCREALPDEPVSPRP